MGIFADNRGTLITRTNARGQFTVTVPDDQATTSIVVWREDVMGAGYLIDVANFRERPLIVAVERGARIEVYVVDTAGQPVVQAKLSCSTMAAPPMPGECAGWGLFRGLAAGISGSALTDMGI